MSVAERTIVKPANAKSKPIVNQILDLLSSVRFGIALLVFLVLLSMVGMLIVQENVNEFERFYAANTPAEKYIYNALGLFDIYHTWYFNLTLIVLSLNIVLASIDRFPTAWLYISKPKTEATKAYLLNQKFNAQIVSEDDNFSQNELTEKVTKAFRRYSLKPRVTNKGERQIIFGERFALNRLGAYSVHVALLSLFLGHFVALQTGYDADIQLQPGTTTNQIQLLNYDLINVSKTPVKLPFQITCTDIGQKLIDPSGSIEINNTMDWFTKVTIADPIYGVREAKVALNQPFSYRGFRFFQASAITQGNARSMTLKVTPQNGDAPFDVALSRNSVVNLPDGTKIEHLNFFSDFALAGGKPQSKSPDYNNPAVQVQITAPNNETKTAYIFAAELPNGAPVGAPTFGYKFKLSDYEKSPQAHILSIKYDPFYGSTVAWYFGGTLLILSLCGVFFLAHQRVWAIIEPNGTITLGGHANRNEVAFGDKFDKIKADLDAKNEHQRSE
ncbi:MAG: cytochrome c biogenesis protein ResB [Pyrinomonadaceae bacterium]|nr:cytochrome c biogenesis protein ResB [Pyrinomonadaceae bacterium]